MNEVNDNQERYEGSFGEDVEKVVELGSIDTSQFIFLNGSDTMIVDYDIKTSVLGKESNTDSVLFSVNDESMWIDKDNIIELIECLQGFVNE